jgi:hypothetical protein
LVLLDGGHCRHGRYHHRNRIPSSTIIDRYFVVVVVVVGTTGSNGSDFIRTEIMEPCHQDSIIIVIIIILIIRITTVTMETTNQIVSISMESRIDPTDPDLLSLSQ